MQQRWQLMIGKLMLIGAMIAALLTLIGGVMFLLQQGGQPITYHLFNSTNSYINNYFSARGLILIGLYVLVFTQILRVIFTTWLFVKLKDYVFVTCCLIVLSTLLYSILT